MVSRVTKDLSVDEALRALVAERDWEQFHTPVNLAKSIAIEAGELLECFQWNDEAPHERVVEELADVLTYARLLAARLGVDPDQIVLDKLEVTRAKYPAERSRGRSAKYDELSDRAVPVRSPRCSQPAPAGPALLELARRLRPRWERHGLRRRVAQRRGAVPAAPRRRGQATPAVRAGRDRRDLQQVGVPGPRVVSDPTLRRRRSVPGAEPQRGHHERRLLRARALQATFGQSSTSSSSVVSSPDRSGRSRTPTCSSSRRSRH